jgi:ABC-type lipoprotein release transport system permease subunit
MIILQLAFKDLLGEPKHLLSYILTVGSMIAVAVIPLAIGNAYLEQLTGIMPKYSYDHYLVVNASAGTLSESIIDYKLIGDTLKNKGVEGFPQLVGTCKVIKGVESFETFLRGAYLSSLYKFKHVSLRGNIPKNISEVNVGVLLAERLNISVNDEILLEVDGEKHVFRVAGILRCNCPYDEEVLIQLEDVWRLMPDLDGRVTLIEYSGELNSGRLEYLGMRVIPLQPTTQAVTGIVESTFNTIRNWALAICTVVFASSYFASLKICVDSLDRVASLRNIGLSRKKTGLFLFYKALIASLMSILVGISIGIVSSQVIFRALSLILSAEAYKPPILTLSDLALVSIVSSVLSIIGSIPPIVRVSRTRA